MDDLATIDTGMTIESREIAKMIGKQHKNLLRDIQKYISDMEPSSNLSSADFFIESSYIDGNNQQRLCYLLTKKGCEFVANKMTGSKGNLFTADYISKFNEMEQNGNQIDLSNLSPELQMVQGLINSQAKQELATKKLESKVDGISDIVSLNVTDWRKQTNSLIRAMAKTQGGYGAYKEIGGNIYAETDRRAGADLNRRLQNLRSRMALEGASKSKVAKTNRLDVLEEDKRLKEIYLAVVKDFAIKYQVWNKEY